MISVIIPALNESKTIASLVNLVRSQPYVSEVIVIDDGSIDETPQIARQAGALVITSTLLGKGASFADGFARAANEIVIFLDADLSDLAPNMVSRLTDPIRSGETNFVKAKFTRSAGRVTTLTAKPLLKVFFPELANIEQPLGGIIAARRSTLEKIQFELDYGVDLGILIDLHMLGEKIVEVDIGQIEHDSQPLHDLSAMASQVIRTLFHRAEKHQRFRIEQLIAIEEWERRQESGSVDKVKLQEGEHSICLFDMDGTLIQERFIQALAKAVGKELELSKFLDHPSMHPVNRTKAIGGIFAGVPFETFVSVARQIPLCDEAVETVRCLRKRGFRVGIVSDSFRVATETIRRRVFADFSVAHVMEFHNQIATGEIELCRTMFHDHGCSKHLLCKKNVVLHLAAASGVRLHNFAAVGDGENDICMFETVKTGIAFEPKTAAVRAAANYVISGSLSRVLPLLINQPIDGSVFTKGDGRSSLLVEHGPAASITRNAFQA